MSATDILDDILAYDGGDATDLLSRAYTEIENARTVLVFADGVAVANTGYALADLYASDFEPAQSVLKSARCHPRGKIPALRRGEEWSNPA